MPEHLLAWHFAGADRRLGYQDGREIRVGETLTVDCQPVLCEAGLHASVNAIDALGYSRGMMVCRVRVGGTIVIGDDKVTATERTCLAMADATNAIQCWACDCAERALQRERGAGREPHAVSWAAIDTKRHWLRGEASDSELEAASAAAREAASAAASAAERMWQEERLEAILSDLLGLEDA